MVRSRKHCHSGPAYTLPSVVEDIADEKIEDSDESNAQIKSGIKQEMTFSPIDCLSYTFYLPLFMCGPIMTYNDFNTQVNDSIS